MVKLELDGQFYRWIGALRAQVRSKFQELRILGAEGDVSGSERLERVPALRKRDFKLYLSGRAGELKQRIAARRLLDFLRGTEELPKSARMGLRSEIERELNALRKTELWIKCASKLDKALDPFASLDTCEAEVSNAVKTGLTPAQNQEPLPEHPKEPEPADEPTGRSTGPRRNRISELCHAQAEWRNTNLGQDERRWLQLFVRFDRSYTRARGGGPGDELSVQVHRVHVDVLLDGGSADSRDPWIESAVSSGSRVQIFEGNSWTPERPCYEIDNPVRSSPLTGHFGWFDLCQVNGVVGEKASLEISVSIGGISVPVPDHIREQLDPSPKHPYDTPELHLIEGWLRHRLIPRGRLKAGVYQLTQIDLQKSAS